MLAAGADGGEALCQLVISRSPADAIKALFDTGVAAAGAGEAMYRAAAAMGAVETLTLLLDGGSSPDSADASGRRALHIAIRNRREGVARAEGRVATRGGACRLPQRGAPGLAPPHWTPPLADPPSPIRARLNAAHSREAAMQLLLGRGADPDAAVPSGGRLLGLAAGKGWASAVGTLTGLGADVAAADGNGWTALPFAASPEAGSRACVAALLDAGAPIHAAAADGRQPVHVTAAFDGDSAPSALRALLERGADARAADGDGGQPVHCAARWGLPESLDMLCGLGGASANQPDAAGQLPLHLEAERGWEDDDTAAAACGRALLSRGARVDAAFADGGTALHAAVRTCNVGVIRALLAGGADAEIGDADGNQAFHLAADAANEARTAGNYSAQLRHTACLLALFRHSGAHVRAAPLVEAAEKERSAAKTLA